MKISVITVSFNSARTIRDTLESVRDQRYNAVEHLVVDGLSTDGTPDLVRQYPHVARLVHEADRGLYDAMNKGIALSTGAVVGILNSDDFYAHPDVLAHVADVFRKTDAGAVYGDLCYVHPRATDRTIRYWRSGHYTPNQFRYGWMPPHPTFFVRREYYEQLGAYDLDFRMAADYELMLRFLVKHRIPAAYLPEVLVHMRAGGISNASLRHRWLANREDRRAWIKNGMRPALYTMWLKPLRKIPQYWKSAP